MCWRGRFGSWQHNGFSFVKANPHVIYPNELFIALMMECYGRNNNNNKKRINLSSWKLLLFSHVQWKILQKCEEINVFRKIYRFELITHFLMEFNLFWLFCKGIIWKENKKPKSVTLFTLCNGNTSTIFELNTSKIYFIFVVTIIQMTFSLKVSNYTAITHTFRCSLNICLLLYVARIKIYSYFYTLTL